MGNCGLTMNILLLSMSPRIQVVLSETQSEMLSASEWSVPL